jgi:acetamidase/formamidase
MNYQRLLSLGTDTDCNRVMPDRIEPVAHVTLGDAIDVRRRDACGNGKISEESFQKIRSFRTKMAEYDKKWGRG